MTLTLTCFVNVARGGPHQSQFLPYGMNNVPIRRCASKPHESHFSTGGQQLRVDDSLFIPICYSIVKDSSADLGVVFRTLQKRPNKYKVNCYI